MLNGYYDGHHQVVGRLYTANNATQNEIHVSIDKSVFDIMYDFLPPRSPRRREITLLPYPATCAALDDCE